MIAMKQLLVVYLDIKESYGCKSVQKCKKYETIVQKGAQLHKVWAVCAKRGQIEHGEKYARGVSFRVT